MSAGIIIILGIVAIGGWCFLAGPCKGAHAVMTDPTFKKMQNDPRVKQIAKDLKEGKITEAEARARAQALGKQLSPQIRASFGAKYASSYYGHRSGYRY